MQLSQDGVPIFPTIYKFCLQHYGLEICVILQLPFTEPNSQEHICLQLGYNF